MVSLDTNCKEALCIRAIRLRITSFRFSGLRGSCLHVAWRERLSGKDMQPCRRRQNADKPRVLPQATATMSDGRVFVIGGSWSGGVGKKNGEVHAVVVCDEDVKGVRIAGAEQNGVRVHSGQMLTTSGRQPAPSVSSCLPSCMLSVTPEALTALPHYHYVAAFPQQVFDGTVWHKVTGCLVAPMNTSDADVTKQDSHAWLFGWKNATILQVCCARLVWTVCSFYWHCKSAICTPLSESCCGG